MTGDGGVGAALTYPPFFQGSAANLAPTSNPSIEGGAYTTAHDYGKILLMHLRGGLCDRERVLSQSAVELMRQDRIGQVYAGMTNNPAFAGYGLGWWVDRQHPGVVADPGAYGAVPWLDIPRGYGAFVLLEANGQVGPELLTKAKPALDTAFDAVATGP